MACFQPLNRERQKGQYFINAFLLRVAADRHVYVGVSQIWMLERFVPINLFAVVIQ